MGNCFAAPVSNHHAQAPPNLLAHLVGLEIQAIGFWVKFVSQRRGEKRSVRAKDKDFGTREKNRFFY
ncbi:hypothetical protein I3842_07G051900 [Carya illinoinensis]|uniref:Uncharacterized protein n=1 Tax=Carya illinoinensis TaxID=32201 RepID=A0A922EIN0_CARIL|nr:hypothetical protein I3842_07G051900 [Carya illinoinensis]